tara:strand:+ start:231 stop:590 length:360 start_codon:yes stop_codon:yes gene_type:complete
MLYDDKLANWMINEGGEVDMPRNPEANWGTDKEVAYRSIRWNAKSGNWEYYTRITCPGEGVHITVDMSGPDDGNKLPLENSPEDHNYNSLIHLIYDNLADMVRETNKIHAIDDKVTTEL